MITSEKITQTAARLAARARKILPPERAILLECAFEGEGEPAAARELERMIARFNRCAASSETLEDAPQGCVVFLDVGEGADAVLDLTSEGFEEAIRRALELSAPPEPASGTAAEPELAVYVRRVPGDTVALTLAPVGADFLVTAGECDPAFCPGGASFVTELAELVTQSTGDALIPLAPLALGVGIADELEAARELAYRALFRPAGRHASDPTVAEAERRLTATINREGPGAFGRGGGHTALTTAIERDGEGWLAVAIGGPFTSYAAELL
ncbi:MAG: fumarate hydratase [Oscillospiraceae bacterium]|jgi:fumarate hydratase subunit alpha|nr:fumarate hydratase [Oscillospiraceae bacterium]